MRLQDFNNLVQKPSQAEHNQGYIELLKSAREHATSYSARIDDIVLSDTKNNVATDFGVETPSKRRKPISSPSTSSSPGTSPTSVAGQVRRKYCRMQAQHLRKLEGGNDTIERGSRGAAVELQ